MEEYGFHWVLKIAPFDGWPVVSEDFWRQLLLAPRRFQIRAEPGRSSDKNVGSSLKCLVRCVGLNFGLEASIFTVS